MIVLERLIAFVTTYFPLFSRTRAFFVEVVTFRRGNTGLNCYTYDVESSSRFDSTEKIKGMSYLKIFKHGRPRKAVRIRDHLLLY